MIITRLYTGRAFDIYGLVMDGVCLVREYIDSLNEEELKRVLVLLNRICEHGPPNNKRKYRHIGDQIYELKTHSGTRILSFYGSSGLPNSLILTHGFHKPKKKVLEREKERSVSWREPTFEIVDNDY